MGGGGGTGGGALFSLPGGFLFALHQSLGFNHGPQSVSKKNPQAGAFAIHLGSGFQPNLGEGIRGTASVRFLSFRTPKTAQVVHGKEIPWNLFSPKAPYKGKARDRCRMQMEGPEASDSKIRFP